MSGNKWTKDQLTAITARDCNLLVAAAAGAGKTAVLVERLIRRITDEVDPVDVDRLLVVTFTKAAAGEMRERIGHAIAKELNNNPHSRHLNRQVNLLNKASITTLHSFCLDIIRQYFYRLDLDPAFRIADDTEGALMRMETLEEVFERRYLAGDETFLNLVDAYGGERDDSKLQEIILALYEFSSSHPWPEAWLNNLVNLYRFGSLEGEDVNEDGLSKMEDHPWVSTFLDWLHLELEGYKLKLERALALAKRPGGPEEYIVNLLDDINVINDLLLADHSFTGIYHAITSISFGKLKSCRNKDVDDQLKEMVKSIRDEVKGKIADLTKEIFSRPPQEYFCDLSEMVPLVAVLVDIVIEFSQEYQRVKTEKSLVDFSDLEHYCLKILLDEQSEPEKIIPSEVAKELQEKFAEVLVDEYQDINNVQETILQLVSRQASSYPNNMFMVGDVKQSIYRFRLAEPGLFMGKYLAFPREEGLADRGVDLAKNFRSRREVVSGVNFIFRQLMTPQVGEMSYDEKAELVCGADYPEIEGMNLAKGPIELHLIEKKISDDELDLNNGTEEKTIRENQVENEDENVNGYGSIQEQLAELDATQREARLVAKRILQMIKVDQDNPNPAFQVFDKFLGGYRPVQFRDIVILLRATRDSANVFIEEFRQLGIPAFADLGTGYFEATEVETMMSLLKIIDNPRQDIPLVGVLRSPIVGLNAEELAAIKVKSTDGDFYQALINVGINQQKNQEIDGEGIQGNTEDGLEQTALSEELINKLEAFLSKLDKWRTSARQGSLADLIWQLYNETGFYTYVGGMPGGAQRQANLRALYDRARQYEATTFRGLFRFLRFIEKFLDSGSDLGAARALGENEDVVRIMSIHKSKGLEFPVVFVAGMGKQFNTLDLKKKALLHKELGLGIPVVDTRLSLSYPSLAQISIKRKLKMELLAEEMRVLYVALTRAKEKLILVGSVRDLDKLVARWSENANHQHWTLPDADLAKAKTYLDWVCPAVARHKDGEVFRRLSNIEDLPVDITFQDPSGWSIYFWNPEDSLVTAEKDSNDQRELLEQVRRLLPVAAEGEYTGTINEILSWSYPYSDLVGKAAKTTVSELKRRTAMILQDEESNILYQPKIGARPRFLQEKTGLSPSERGSAMHLVMQHLRLGENLNLEEIHNQISEMQIKELLTPEQAEAVDIAAIHGLFATTLGERILKAQEVRREVPFTMALEADSIYIELSQKEVENYKGEKILIQGVIDCLLVEEDGLVLIDYKSDRVTDNSEEIQKLVDNYNVQLNLYARAIEGIFKKRVKEKYIYSFAIRKAIEC